MIIDPKKPFAPVTSVFICLTRFRIFLDIAEEAVAFAGEFIREVPFVYPEQHLQCRLTNGALKKDSTIMEINFIILYSNSLKMKGIPVSFEFD
jgi:hypothetical protein